MKSIIIPIITFIIGVALGISGMIFTVQKGPNQVIANIAQGYTSEGAIYGTLLFEKRYDDLQKLIENGFLTSLNFQKGLDLPKESYISSQKFVRGYFDATGRPIPASIEEHIQDIPKGSGTDMHRFADGMAQTIK
jgi:hypothetical protein